MPVTSDGRYSAEMYAQYGFAVLGGCYCGASIASYNAYPSRTGDWMCGDCISQEMGFDTPEEFFAWEKKREEEEEADLRRLAEAEAEWLKDLGVDGPCPPQEDLF